jgi:membrane protease YdiL (CAAX protease family)
MERRMTSGPSRWFVASVALVVFALANASGDLLALIPGYREFVGSWPDTVRWLWQPFRWAMLIAVGLAVVHRLPLWRAGRELGFRRPILVPLVFCVVCSAPMTIVPLFFAPLRELVLIDLLFAAGVWVIAEEVLYRGYCFRQLHRRAGWNLWIAAAATGVVFGLVHLGNAEIHSLPLAEQVPSIALIAAGGLVFAWLFAAWGDNIWVPTFIHGLMNLGWELYAIDEHPAAGWLVITLRVAVVVLAITGTVLGSFLGWFGLPARLDRA